MAVNQANNSEGEEQNENGNGESDDSSSEERAAAPSAEDSLREQLEALKKEFLYQKAEHDNYRKRMLREQDQAIKFANEKVFRELPNIVDLLDRGIAHGKKLNAKGLPIETEFQNFLNGIEMTQRELVQLLSRFGVEFTGKVGEKFDPNLHEAVSQLETSEDQEGQVLEVLQRGTLYQGRLLAPAKVIVGVTK